MGWELVTTPEAALVKESQYKRHENGPGLAHTFYSRRNSCQHTIEFASTTRWRNHEPDYHLSTEKWWHPRIKGMDRIAAVRTGVGEAFGVLMHVRALGSPF
jgi:hypothetical protein